MLRVGIGYDLHRLVLGRNLIIGGEKIESEFGEEAHSDGDVLIHAVIDSILSPLGEGDIGQKYPDTDPAYRDMNSLNLLADVKDRYMKNAKIINIDAVVILDKPKILPYIEKIRQNIAGALKISADYFHIKGKTSENTAPFSISAYCVTLLEIS